MKRLLASSGAIATFCAMLTPAFAWETRTTDSGTSFATHTEGEDIIQAYCTQDTWIVNLSTRSPIDPAKPDNPNFHVLVFAFDNGAEVLTGASSRPIFPAELIESVMNDPASSEELKRDINAKQYTLFFSGDAQDRFMAGLRAANNVQFIGKSNGEAKALGFFSLRGSSTALNAVGC